MTAPAASRPAREGGAAARPPVDNRPKILEATMKRHQYQPDALIEVLHKAQELYGFLSPQLLGQIARSLRVPLSRVYGVATFYHFFTLKPQGEHTCTVCLGTACYVKGAAALLAAIEQETGVRAGHTSPDGKLSVMTARCLGACGIAPAMVFDNQVLGGQTPETAVAHIRRMIAGGS
ncbi:MAG TPA: bidirectional hydrogenase complex protein HoxE [Roseiflexaceae bacterium]|nr:bidirectional hydrogenase complex protein HoxE [Roseiflexaceae bacterium]